MIRKMNYGSVPFRLSLGFAGTMLMCFAFTHTGISYLLLLGISAVHDKLPLKQMSRWVRSTNPVNASIVVGILTIASSLAIPSPAFAQWAGARAAADNTLGTYIGTNVTALLFTVVFLLLFFLIMGGLMAWGYKAFRNEDAAVPMTAFIVGTVIFVGGEVFSTLFFSNQGGNAAGP